MRVGLTSGSRLGSVGLVAIPLLLVPQSLSLGTGPVVETASASVQAAPSYGVYVRLVERAEGSFDEVVASLKGGVREANWEVLADYEAGVERDDCSYRAHVMAVHSADYAQQVLRRGVMAAFALPLRMVVYEDEGGIHVAATNPLSLTRTIIAESGFEGPARQAVAQLKGMVSGMAAGQPLEVQYGQMRDRGLIGKTMGLIAGGPFDSKIQRAVSYRLRGDDDLKSVATRLYEGLEQLGGSRKWEIRPVFKLDLADDNVVVIGVTGAAAEARAFQIVAKGGDDARKDMACPGIDHAAAFPIELVLTRENDRVNIYLIDEMFRMKMYFEDAGKMKFAANMRMPGSIEDEIRDKIEESLY